MSHVSQAALFARVTCGARTMGLVCKTKIEKAWLVASMLALVMHRLFEGSSPGYDHGDAPLILWLELLMIALSFPLGGLTVFALHSLSFLCDDCRSIEFLFDWPTLLFAGYIQWFWVLPEVARSRKLTLLDLKRTAETIAPNTSPAIKEIKPAPVSTAVTVSTAAPLSTATPLSNASLSTAAPVSTALPASRVAASHSTSEDAPLDAFDTNAYMPALAEFDAAGLTALDRVLQASPASPASPPQLEAIFPRVD